MMSDEAADDSRWDEYDLQLMEVSLYMNVAHIADLALLSVVALG